MINDIFGSLWVSLTPIVYTVFFQIHFFLFSAVRTAHLASRSRAIWVNIKTSFLCDEIMSRTRTIVCRRRILASWLLHVVRNFPAATGVTCGRRGKWQRPLPKHFFYLRIFLFAYWVEEGQIKSGGKCVCILRVGSNETSSSFYLESFVN
jgi:hypothetical protein